MRIVGGKHRGRRLTAPEGLALRPTADRTREAVFNILTQGKLEWRGSAGAPGNPLAGIRVLDAFAGTGALGLEALSRGAGQVTFMESQAVSLAACRNMAVVQRRPAQGAGGIAHAQESFQGSLRNAVSR